MSARNVSARNRVFIVGVLGTAVLERGVLGQFSSLLTVNGCFFCYSEYFKD